ncbi:hypothetical protein HDU86_004845 [Geranomyces michiganensis]|nr:hypothetical protein HDU86_004845 [Geranomyces michiganensis]
MSLRAVAGPPLKYPLVITEPDSKGGLSVSTTNPQIKITVNCITRYGSCPTGKSFKRQTSEAHAPSSSLQKLFSCSGDYKVYFVENNKISGSAQTWPITSFPATATFVAQFLFGGSDAIALRFPGASIFGDPTAADSIQGGQFKSASFATVDAPLLPLLWGVLDQTQPVPTSSVAAAPPAATPTADPAAVPAVNAPSAPAAAIPANAAGPVGSSIVTQSGSASGPQTTQAVSGDATSQTNSADDNSSSESRLDLIIGFSVIAVIAILVGIIVWLVCRRRYKRRNGLTIINNSAVGRPAMSSPPSALNQTMRNTSFAPAAHRPVLAFSGMAPNAQNVSNSLFDRTLAAAQEPAPVVLPVPPPRDSPAPGMSYGYSTVAAPSKGMHENMSNSAAASSAITRQNTAISNSTYNSTAVGRQSTVQSAASSSHSHVSNYSPFGYAGPHEPKTLAAMRMGGHPYTQLYDASSSAPSVSGSSASGRRKIPTHEVDSGVSEADADALKPEDVLPPMYDSLVPSTAAASVPARDVKAPQTNNSVHPGAVVRATRAYSRQHADELDLEVGKMLVVTEMLSGGRARGFLLGTSVSGVFSLSCVALLPDGQARKMFES